MAFLVPIVSICVSSVAEGQTTYAEYKAALAAANNKAHEASAVFSMVADAAISTFKLESAQNARVKANWGAHFAGNAANRATQTSHSKAIAAERDAALADLKSASAEFKSALVAYKAAALEVKQAAPDWGTGLANANLANIKASASKDYTGYANTGFLDTAVKIGEYKAWLDVLLAA